MTEIFGREIDVSYFSEQHPHRFASRTMALDRIIGPTLDNTERLRPPNHPGI